MSAHEIEETETTTPWKERTMGEPEVNPWHGHITPACQHTPFYLPTWEEMDEIDLLMNSLALYEWRDTHLTAEQRERVENATLPEVYAYMASRLPEVLGDRALDEEAILTVLMEYERSLAAE